jgi:hypothetical protein
MVKTSRDFAPGDRVVFQYASGTALHGTIEGWTDKYTAYMLHCDTGRKLLVSPAHLRPEPREDLAMRERREKHWPVYAIYLITDAGKRRIWAGKARTPRLAFERAAEAVPSLGRIVQCKDYKRINAGRKYPFGPDGEHAYCEKIPSSPGEGEEGRAVVPRGVWSCEGDGARDRNPY